MIVTLSGGVAHGRAVEVADGAKGCSIPLMAWNEHGYDRRGRPVRFTRRINRAHYRWNGRDMVFSHTHIAPYRWTGVR